MRRVPGQTCDRHLHFFTLMDCPGCEAYDAKVHAAFVAASKPSTSSPVDNSTDGNDPSPLCGEPGYTHCPDCGVDAYTRHLPTCPTQGDPSGPCGDPECHVLHADPANPIHPPWYVDSRANQPADTDPSAALP